LSLSGDVVTAVFSGEFYIESPDRSAGIKVISAADVKEQDVVDIAGVVGRNSVERVVTATSVYVSATGWVGPLYLSNRDLGGAGDAVVPGVSGGVGLNNVGLLVTTSGKVTFVGYDYIYIDDGSNPSGEGGCAGVKVSSEETSDLSEGSVVVVTDIITLESDGTTFWPFVRTRNYSDMVVRVY